MTLQEVFENAILQRNINNVEIILNKKKFNIEDYNQRSIGFAVYHGYYDAVKLLLKYKKCKPENNNTIIVAYNNKHNDIIQLLWDHKNVKEYLIKDEPEIYNLISNIIVQIKIKEF